MDPVQHYFQLRENDVSHADAADHIWHRFAITNADLTRLLNDYRNVVRARLALLSGDVSER